MHEFVFLGQDASCSAMKRALLTMLKWVKVAPLGEPVVPLVNWMLIGVVGIEGFGEVVQARFDAPGRRSRQVV